MKAWRILVAALSIALGWTASASDGWHRPFTLMGPEQGIPNGGIMCMAQDSDGFIWLGTESGLLRYEGGQCRKWTRKDGLPSDNVDRLLAIPGGGLWISTAQGLARFRQGRIEALPFGPRLHFTVLQSMAMDASGHMWAATDQGLLVQTHDLEFQRHSHPLPGQVLAVTSGRAGAMHVGTDRGLFTFHLSGRVESWTAGDGLPAKGAALVGEDGAGRLWVYSERALVMKPTDATRFTDQSNLLKAGVTPFGVFFKDQDGALWLPTLKGAVRLQGDQPTLLDAAAGLPMRWVRNVFRDREGGFWILGTALARLQGNDRVWNHPLTAGPSGEIVWSMLRDPRGVLLVGTDDGVVRMGPMGPVRIAGTEGHRVKGMAFDGTGMLWMVGTTGPTLWLPPGGQLASVAPLGEAGANLNTVMADAGGQIWISHSRLGILRWDASHRRLVEEVGPDKTAGATLGAFQIRQDATGRLWAATSKGLYLRGPAGAWQLFTEKDGILPFGLHGMAFLPDGSAWIHSVEPQGLQRIRIDGHQVSVVEHRHAGQGLHSNTIYAVGVDPQGRTWATTDLGFDCLDTRVHVGRLEGVISEDCDLLGLLTENGRIWVGTSAGLVRYEAGDGDPMAAPPVPHILQVQKGEHWLESPLGSMGPVGPRESNLAFRVAVPSYRHEGQMKIQVRMVGLDEAWRDMDAPLTRYQALPGGSYRFETRAAQPDGAFGPVTSLSFKVMPPWWRTWWAQFLWAMGGVGLILLLVRLRVANLAQSKADLELVVAERTEELRNRNDELTDALGKVKQLSGLLPICASCKKIRDDRGYWNQLEHYISDHSEVGFSHGICPDCVGTMFPGRAARKNRLDDEQPA